MAEITLNRYLAKLDALQKQGLHHEVILHARHILEKYPKNAAAHRLLAHTLLASNQHDDAEHEFRRVLSAYPDDPDPYMGLSRIAAFRRRFDEAIGYAERAADLKPGDPDIARYLRDLYADHRGLRDARIPQGPYTVALQQRRAGLFNRAADTLKAALAQHPERVDLRVLLAETHWDNENPIDAAELAIDILKTLPNCLAANRILTSLWLGEQRPSDAQRYLSFVEAVDPYAAFSLISDGTPPDNAFSVDELDYQSEARRQLATLEPEWLDAVDASTEIGFDEPVPAPQTELEPETTLDDLLGLNDSSDWMTAIDEVKAEADSPTRTVKGHVIDEQEQADFLSLFADFEDEAPAATAFDDVVETVEDNTPPRRPRSSMPSGLLRQLDSDEQKPADLPASEPPKRSPRTAATGLSGLLRALEEDESGEAEPDVEGTGVTGLINELEKSDQSTGVTDLINELEREDEGTGVTGLINQLEQPDEGTGVTGLINELEREDEGTGVTGLINELERGEAPQGTGLTGLLRNLEAVTPSDAEDEDFEETVGDDFDWLTQTDVAPNTRPTTQLDPELAGIFESSRRQTGMVAEQPDDSFAEFEPEIEDEEQDAAAWNEVEPAAAAGQGEIDPEDPLAWMRDSGIELFDVPQDQMAAMLAEEADDAGVTYSDPHADDPLAWMREQGIEVMDTGELQNLGGDTADLTARRAAQEPLADAVNDENDQEEDPLGWMQDTGVELRDELDVENSLDWMRDTDELRAILDAPASEAGGIDLFTGMDDEKGDAMSDKNEPGMPDWDDFEDDGDKSPEETPDWLANMGVPSGDRDADEDAVPEWLSGTEFEELVDAEDAAFELADEDDSELPAAEAADVPDWLRSAQPAVTQLDDDFADIDDIDEEEAITADVPDWLAAAAPATLLEDAATQLGDELEPEDEALLDAIGEPTMLEGDIDFDLLADEVVSELAGDAGEVEAALSDSQALSWLSDLDEEDSADVVEADVITEGDFAEFEMPEKPEEDEQPEWLTAAAEIEEAAEEEEAAVLDADVPDWLAAAAPGAAFTLLGDAEQAGDVTPEPEEEALQPLAELDDELFEEDEQPEWLAAAADVEEAAEEEEAAVLDTEVPDWLAAAAPVGMDFAGPDDEDADVDADLLPADMPEWLAEEDVEITGSQLEEAVLDDDSAPDWLTEEESQEAAAALPADLVPEDGVVQAIGDALEEDDEALEMLGEELPANWMDTGGFAAATVEDAGDQAPELLGDETPGDWMDTGELMADLVLPTEDSEVDADILLEDSWMAGLAAEDSRPLPFGEEASATPEWLAEAGTDEPASFDELQPLASLDDLEDDAELEAPAAAGDQPDWLASALAAAGLSATGDIVDEDEQDEDFAPVSDEEAQEQADAYTFEAAAEDEEAMADFAALADLDADVDLEEDLDLLPMTPLSELEEDAPEWLSKLQEEEEALVAQEQEDEALAGQVSWLDADSDADQDLDEAAPAPAQTPEWLADTVDEDDAGIMEPGELPDWLEAVGQSAQQDQNVPPVGDTGSLQEDMPQWLSDVGDMQLADDEMEFLTDSEEVEAISEDIPEWLSGMPLSAVMDAEQADDAFDAQIYDIDEDAELAFAESERWGEQINPTPAENAPDWLNAMVPGLDVDYMAQDEDAPVESEYAELAEDAAVVAKASRDYAWVSDIVDEELKPPTALPTATQEAAAVAAEESAPRFRFTRAPRWLRRLRGEFGVEQVPVNTLDDLEEDANSVPDWLTFDDDDDNK